MEAVGISSNGRKGAYPKIIVKKYNGKKKQNSR